MTEIQELVVPSSFSELTRVLTFVRTVCREAGLSEDDVFACELATDEACANIIEHAYSGRGDGRIQITCQRVQDILFIRLHDHGRPFDPKQVAPPDLTSDLASRRLGGLGLHFMRSMMDELHFQFDETHGNTLTMVKQIR